MELYELLKSQKIVPPFSSSNSNGAGSPTSVLSASSKGGNPGTSGRPSVVSTSTVNSLSASTNPGTGSSGTTPRSGTVSVVIGGAASIKPKINRQGDYLRYHRGTYLHVAAAHNHDHTVAWLLQNGADITAANASGDTPMHLAVAKRSLACVIVMAQYLCAPQNHDILIKLLRRGNDDGKLFWQVCPEVETLQPHDTIAAVTPKFQSLFYSTVVPPNPDDWQSPLGNGKNGGLSRSSSSASNYSQRSVSPPVTPKGSARDGVFAPSTRPSTRDSLTSNGGQQSASPSGPSGSTSVPRMKRQSAYLPSQPPQPASTNNSGSNNNVAPLPGLVQDSDSSSPKNGSGPKSEENTQPPSYTPREGVIELLAELNLIRREFDLIRRFCIALVLLSQIPSEKQVVGSAALKQVLEFGTHLNELRALLSKYASKGFYLQNFGDLGCPPILYAVRANQLEVVKILIEVGGKPQITDTVDIHGNTILHYSVNTFVAKRCDTIFEYLQAEFPQEMSQIRFKTNDQGFRPGEVADRPLGLLSQSSRAELSGSYSLSISEQGRGMTTYSLGEYPQEIKASTNSDGVTRSDSLAHTNSASTFGAADGVNGGLGIGIVGGSAANSLNSPHGPAATSMSSSKFNGPYPLPVTNMSNSWITASANGNVSGVNSKQSPTLPPQRGSFSGAGIVPPVAVASLMANSGSAVSLGNSSSHFAESGGGEMSPRSSKAMTGGTPNGMPLSNPTPPEEELGVGWNTSFHPEDSCSSYGSSIIVAPELTERQRNLLSLTPPSRSFGAVPGTTATSFAVVGSPNTPSSRTPPAPIVVQTSPPISPSSAAAEPDTTNAIKGSSPNAKRKLSLPNPSYLNVGGDTLHSNQTSFASGGGESVSFSFQLHPSMSTRAPDDTDRSMTDVSMDVAEDHGPNTSDNNVTSGTNANDVHEVIPPLQGQEQQQQRRPSLQPQPQDQFLIPDHSKVLPSKSDSNGSSGDSFVLKQVLSVDLS
jgi:ankyrin repeat protein